MIDEIDKDEFIIFDIFLSKGQPCNVETTGEKAEG